jgi:hypothetical protein
MVHLPDEGSVMNSLAVLGYWKHSFNLGAGSMYSTELEAGHLKRQG